MEAERRDASSSVKPAAVPPSEPSNPGPISTAAITWVLLGLILLILLLISMRIMLVGNEPTQNVTTAGQDKIALLDERTSAMKSELGGQEARLAADEALIATLRQDLNTLSDQVSQLQKSGKNSSTREFQKLNDKITEIQQILSKLKVSSFQKSIGIININSH